VEGSQTKWLNLPLERGKRKGDSAEKGKEEEEARMGKAFLLDLLLDFGTGLHFCF